MMFLSRLVAGIDQNLFSADAVQERRGKHLRCEHIQILLKAVFQFAEQTAQLQQVNQIATIYAKVDVALRSGFASCIRAKQIERSNAMTTCNRVRNGFDFIYGIDFFTYINQFLSIIL